MQGQKAIDQVVTAAECGNCGNDTDDMQDGLCPDCYDDMSGRYDSDDFIGYGKGE